MAGLVPVRIVMVISALVEQRMAIARIVWQ